VIKSTNEEEPMKKLLILVFAVLLPALQFALEPPRPFEIEALKANGQFEQRQEFAKKLGNNIMKLQAPGIKSHNNPSGLPSTGSPKMFVLLIEFPDYPHTIEASTIQEMLFGLGNEGYYPYESLRSYYQRSSYGKLNIEGDVYGWYRAANMRDTYTDDSEGLIEEAIAYYHSQGARFDKYDNDGNGEVEYFAVFWTGPDEGWASFWWGWQGFFYDPEYSVDGKKLGAYSWQWEEETPGTVIHESGHALGLPDYYDYDDAIGPRGGTGGLDMMDGVWGDHNGFSKWMLGWITPQVVTDPASLTLTPLASTPYAVVLAKDFDGSDYGSEFFIIQNRYRVNNDSDFPVDGMLIHHVDARRDCDGYTIYDNSYTEHKLLRLMEADGLEQIEKGKWGDAGDFYKAGGNEFTASSMPCSDLYAGRSSFARVTSFSAGMEQMTADFVLQSVTDLVSPVITAPLNESVDVGVSPEIMWSAVANAGGYEIEIHEGVNTVYKSGTITSDNLSHIVPQGKLSSSGTYAIWLKAKGDGTAYGSSNWAKSVFSTACGDTPYFVAKTFFDPPCLTIYGGFAYHPPTGVFARFGGNGSSETFEYDGSKWTSYSSYPGPSDRYYTAMAYDPVNEKILLFGGYNNNTDDVYGDTWLYDPSTHSWQEMNPPSSPPASWAFRASTDTKRKVVVIYAPGETWEWNGATWTKTTSSGPDYYYGNLAYDPNLQKVIYFGGYQDGTYVCKNETWTYDGTNWTKLAPANPPGKRCDAVLVYHSRLGKTVLFGGSDEDLNPTEDLWAFDGTSWEELSFCGKAPAGYYDMLGAYDGRRGRIVMAKASSETSTYELVGLGGACSPPLDPQSKTFTKAGGNDSFAITVGNGCGWTAESDSEWITITSAASGTGPGTVSYEVSANSGQPRSGSISVNGVAFAITQETGIAAPQVSAISKLGNPFRLKLSGSNFQDGIKIYIGEGAGKIEWTNFSRKSISQIVLKGGATLKSHFPKGTAVTITLENSDGGSTTATYTR
jgi:M6 family metalloprotease-like protein